MSSSQTVESRSAFDVRQRLHADVALLLITAPAGFGKTHLAAGLVAACGRGALCSLRIEDRDADLARLVLEALIREDPARQAALSEAIVVSDKAEMLRTAEQSWSETPRERTIFVFDDLESASESDLETIASFIARCPPQRTIVLCSRTEISRNLIRRVAPHKIETVGAQDLRIGVEDLRAVSPDLDGEAAQKIVLASAGWPIAALLFSRLHAQRRFAEHVQAEGSYETLMAYLLDEYVSGLSVLQQELLQMAWALSSTTAEELVLLLDQTHAGIEHFLRSCPFVTVTASGVGIHALLASAFELNAGVSRPQLLERAISVFSAKGLACRAASCALKLNDPNRAADLLQDVSAAEASQDPSVIASVLRTLDRSAIVARPRLYLATVDISRFTLPAADALAEARQVYYATKNAGDPGLEISSAWIYARMLTAAGRVFEGIDLLEDVVGRHCDVEDAWRLRLRRAGLLAVVGRANEAKNVLEECRPHLDAQDIANALSNISSTIAARNGRHDEGIAYLEEAARIQRAQGAPAALGVSLANIAIEALFGNDDDRIRAAVSELKSNLLPGFERAWNFWLDCATGGGDAEPSGYESVSLLTTAYLLRAIFGESGTVRQAAMQSYEEGKRYSLITARVMTTIAYAERAPDRKKELLPELRSLAAATDINAFRESILRYVDDRPPFGVLDAYVARFRKSVRRGIVRLELTSNYIYLDDERCQLSLREKSLLVFLASIKRHRSRDAICDAIWPEADAENSANNLKVLVHRVRRKLGNGVLASIEDGYCLGADVIVDLEQEENFVRSVRDRSWVEDADFDRLRSIRRKCRLRQDDLMRWDWYAATARRLDALDRDAGLVLANHFLWRNQFDEALLIAKDLIHEDSLDEAAIEAAVKSLLAQGDAGGARATIAQYERELAANFGTALSQNLRSIIGAAT